MITWDMNRKIRAREFDAPATARHGERCGVRKLTAEQARQIRALRATHPQKEVAKMFGVSVGAVGQIQTGRTWGPIDGVLPPRKIGARRSLTPDQVVMAVDMAGKMPRSSIAAHFGVSVSLIGRLVRERDARLAVS